MRNNMYFAIAKSRLELRQGEIEEGVTFLGEHQEIIAEFETLEEAQEAFKIYESEISDYSTPAGRKYLLTEYHLLQCNRDGDVINGLATTALPEIRERITDFHSSAAALYDGGWRKEDKEKYYINYNTGAGNEYVTGTLEEAIKTARDGASYTQCDIDIIDIYDGDTIVATWRWVGLQAEDDEDDIIRFGTAGHYSLIRRD